MTAKRIAILATLAAVGVGAAWIRAQQPASTVERERAAQDQAYQGSWASKAGGTPENELWEVLVLMGVGDREPSTWDGNLEIAAGDIWNVEGYRFELPDRILPQGGWQARTKVERVLNSSPVEGSAISAQAVLPKGLLIRGRGTDATRLVLRTSQGQCDFAPMAVSISAPCAGGRMEVRRVPAETDLSGTHLRHHDFPALGEGADESLSAVWMSYHDRREELNFRRYVGGKWSRLINVARASEDLWRPQVVTDGNAKPWLIWSQQTAGDWDIWAMPWLDNEWGPKQKVSTDALPDIEPSVARASDGTIYVAWQALSGRVSQIRMRYLKADRWSEVLTVTASSHNDWQPAVAAGGDGRVWIAWDRYTSSYDVYLKSYSRGSGFSAEVALAQSPRFEAYPTVAVDAANRPWVAWEVDDENWGKDLGWALGAKAIGKPLGGPRQIEVVCRDGDEWKAAPALRFEDALGQGASGISDPALQVDPNGNIWLAMKRRYSRSGYRPSTFWEAYLTRLDGARWTDPVPLPNSWSRKSTRTGLAASGGRLWAFWTSETRKYDFASRPREGRVIAGSLPVPPAGAKPILTARTMAAVTLSSTNEARDVTAIRAHRTRVGKASMRIVRGDLHRHTELSQDIGGLDDGTLQEFYRYMIDAAEMDFGASTDHQAGGIDYWNFITQKMADMYHFPQRFVPLYGYERNLANPFGHRNIIHTQRDYPIVPFFQSLNPKFMLPDTPDGELLTFNSASFGGGIRNDTALLYEELRKTGGLAIPHTSGSDNMGTDWSDKSDAALEPVVEIYQGARYSSEARNVPRGVQDGMEKKMPGGFQEPGLVWNAWKKGHRLGVIASSDHYSTHISYAMVYTPAMTRKAIFDAIAQRHTYGATDNIVLEFWMGNHFMGDDFTARSPQPIRVKVRGTDAVEAVHVIRDAAYIYKVSPGKPDVDFEYRDGSAGAGEHWYYVRVEQKNGELAWSSPIWVRYR
ncbi:MAG: hypothetical protein R2762_13940 [Bryobacteraceae bacterium]